MFIQGFIVSIQPIARTNLVDQAYRAIKELIVTGGLVPGGQLKIEALSRRLGVSSSPIREALRRLEQERWVEVIPCRGAFVRVFEEAEIREVYELRAILETAALCKIMPTVPADGIAKLEKSVVRIQEALQQGDSGVYLAADVAFHRTLVAIAGNRRLDEVFATLVEQGMCFMLGRTTEAMNRYRDRPDEHMALFEAIRAGRMNEALSLLHHHLNISEESIRGFLRKNKDR